MTEQIQQDRPHSLAGESLAIFERESFAHLSTLGDAIYHLARPYIQASGTNGCGHTRSWTIGFDKVHEKSPAFQNGFTT
jgi:hypothetical protein